jgi:hypothetical protein
MEVTVNNVIRIPTSQKKFFRFWFEFLKPFHKLTDREIDVITAFTYERYLLSKVVSDEDILDKVVMSEDSKKKIREEYKVTPAYFQVIMGKLRRNGLIVNNKINPRFIPNITEDNGPFKLMLLFDIQ